MACEPRGFVRDMREALKWQRLVMKLGMEDGRKPQEVVQLQAAWDRIQERKRILKMRPKPAAVKVPARDRTARPRAAVAQPEVAPAGPSLEAEADKLQQMTTKPVITT